MLDLNRPVQTRSGKPARIIASDVKGSDISRIIALVDHGEEEILAVRTAEGLVLPDGTPHSEDLINVPRVVYRAFDIRAGHSRLGVSMEEPDHVARGDGWNDKILKFTIADDGEVLSVELA